MMRRIGGLMGSAETALDEAYPANFWGRLEALGWKKGRNTRTEVRWWTGGPEQMRTVVAELLALCGMMSPSAAAMSLLEA
jgi:hypothetical protein